MNPELHHRWNAERDQARGSNAPVDRDPQEKVTTNKVLLKQNKPR
jgi:hypothetical protein